MICPKCGNNDVTDPKVCPKCHTVLKINDEKIGAKSTWNNNDYKIKKEKDVGLNKAVFILVFIIILIGLAIYLGLYFDLFSGRKKIELQDALIYVVNINDYIARSKINTDQDGNTIIPTYKVNKVSYNFVNVPSSNECIFNNGKWNNDECNDFIKDVNNFCKGNGRGCVMEPTQVSIIFNNGRVKDGSTITYNNIECIYSLKKADEPLSSKNINCKKIK